MCLKIQCLFVVLQNLFINELCADFIISIFEKRDLGGMKGKFMELNSEILEKYCGYLKEFKILSIDLIKYNKQKIEFPKSDELWRRFYKRHNKKLRSYPWENNYKRKYLSIKSFAKDPIYRTPLYLPNETKIVLVHVIDVCTQRLPRLQN